MNNIKYKSIEIVGTDLGSDGRSCGLHPVCCGEDVLVDTKLKLFKATLKRKIKRTINVPIDTECEIDAAIGSKKRGRPKKDEAPKTKSIEVEEIEEILGIKRTFWVSHSYGHHESCPNLSKLTQNVLLIPKLFLSFE
jgi:hypothetical protein